MLKSLPRFVLVFFAVVMSVSIVTAQDTPSEEAPVSPDHLSLIASYARYDTTLLGVVYTDEASLESLDSTVREITAGLTGSQSIGLADALLAVGLDYDEAAAWVGDFFAIALSPDIFTPKIFLIAHLSDADAARAYIEQVGLPSSSYVIEDEMLIVDVYANMSRQPITQPAAGQRLADVPVFGDLLELMPEERYGVFVYADTPVLMGQAEYRRRYTPSDGLLFAALTRASGITAAGLTYAEDGAMKLDVVSTGGNLSTFEAINLSIAPEPVSAETLAYIPENALFVAHGHDLFGFPFKLWDEYHDSILLQFIAASQGGYMLSASQMVGSVLANTSRENRLDLVLSALLGLDAAEFSSLFGDDYVIFTTDATAQQVPPYRTTPMDVAAIFVLDDDAAPFETFETLARSAQLFIEGSGARRDMAFDITRINGEDGAAPYGRIDFRMDNPLMMTTGDRFSLIITEDVAILGVNEAVDAAFAQLGQPTAAWVTAQESHLRTDAFFNVLVQPEAVLQLAVNLENAGWGRGLPLPLLAKLGGLSATYAITSDNDQFVHVNVALNDAAAMETLLAQISSSLPPAPEPVQPTNTPDAVPTIAAPTAVATLTPLPTREPSPTLPPTVAPQPSATPVPVELPDTADFPTEPVAAIGYGDLLLHRAADGAFILGDPDAPLTLVIFSDWACPHCQNFEPVIEELVAQDLPSGAFNIEHRTLVTAGQDSTPAASSLAECVDILSAGSFWAVRAYLYDVATENLTLYRDASALAAALSTEFAVDENALLACRSSAAQRTVDATYASEVGASSTPFMVIRSANGTLNPINDYTAAGIRAALLAVAAPAPVMDSAQATRAANLANLAATRAAPTVAP